MCQILILYHSKYGSTQKYVDILKEELVCDVFEITSFPFGKVKDYDFIIAASGIYAGGISVIKYIRKNAKILSDKNVIIFAVGASPFHSQEFENVKKRNLKKLPFSAPIFYGRGTYNESIMNLKDRTMCRLLRKSLQKRTPESLESWMEALMETEGKSCDWTDKKYLIPLLNYINEKSY